MGRHCSTCIHPEVETIDRELASSTPVSETSSRFGISVRALRRHQQRHLAAEGSLAPQTVAEADVHRPSDFVEVAVVPPMPSSTELEVELRADEASRILRLRGHIEPEALHVLAQAVVGWPRSAS